jgi:hypothetical protein
MRVLCGCSVSPFPPQQLIEQLQRVPRFLLTATQHHEIVRIPYDLVSRCRQRLIHRVQIDVGEQRTDDGSLGRPGLRSPLLQALHHPLAQVGVEQLEHAAIRDAPLHFRHQLWMGNRVEVALDVGIHHPGVAVIEKPLHLTQRLLAPPAGTKAVTAGMKLPLEDRLSSTIRRALCTTRSLTVGIPSGRFSTLPGFSIQHRRTGFGT